MTSLCRTKGQCLTMQLSSMSACSGAVDGLNFWSRYECIRDHWITGSHRSKFAEQLCNCQNFFASLQRYSTASARHLNSFGSPFIFCELSVSFALTIPEIFEISEIPSTSFTVVPDRPSNHHQRHRSQMTSAAMAADASEHPGVALQPVGPNEFPASVSIRQEIAINAKPC